jgi:hypothetical protein
MPAYFLRSEPGAAELRRLARRESGRVCQRVLMIANMLEGMEQEEAGRLAGLSRSAAYECLPIGGHSEVEQLPLRTPQVAFEGNGRETQAASSR